MFDFTRILIRKNKTGSGLKKTRVRLKKNRVRFKKTGSGLKKPGPVKKKHESGSTNRPVTLRINKRIPLVNLLLAPGPLFMIRPKLDSVKKNLIFSVALLRIQSYRILTPGFGSKIYCFRSRILFFSKTLDQTTQYRKTNHWPILLKL